VGNKRDAKFKKTFSVSDLSKRGINATPLTVALAWKAEYMCRIDGNTT
jgi:hypothetical protein